MHPRHRKSASGVSTSLTRAAACLSEDAHAILLVTSTTKRRTLSIFFIAFFETKLVIVSFLPKLLNLVFIPNDFSGGLPFVLRCVDASGPVVRLHGKEVTQDGRPFWDTNQSLLSFNIQARCQYLWSLGWGRPSKRATHPRFQQHGCRNRKLVWIPHGTRGLN